MNLTTIFITGLTTGGLSCLAMQGGILASAIANQKEEELDTISKSSSSKKKLRQIKSQLRPNSFDQLDWLPVSMFLLAKLISHTILGFFLGFLGSQLELGLTTKLIFQGFAALFMFATAMNLLEVHPIFRYVLIQPPKFINKFIRNSTKSKAIFTPFLIGLFTIFIPCGITQSMEVLAISSGSPLLGAAIMFTFVLGTSPLFALLGVGTAKLTEVWKASFLQIAALSLVFLSLSSINGIFVVLDAPVTFQKIKIAILDPAGIIYSDSQGVAPVSNGSQNVTIDVSNTGYTPNRLRVKSGIPVNLTLKSTNAYTCASFFIFPEFNIRANLQPSDSQTFTFTPTKKGRFTFSCTMGMYTGTLEVI